MKRIKKILKIIGIGLVLVILVGAGVLYAGARQSIIPDNINMSSVSIDGMDMSSMSMGSIGTPDANATPMSQLVAPDDPNAPVKTFTLTAETATVDLGDGKPFQAYTYNGTIPGPELRVQQGDMVVVNLINKLPVSTTVHWHGMVIPNAEDGVAGVTQDAIQPGATYTYRFLANEPGTYWYHPHEETSIQLPKGLFGALIIEPKTPPVTYNDDYNIFLHEWNVPSHDGVQGFFICHATCPETLTVNDQVKQQVFAAKPSDLVRVRIFNSGQDVHFPVLVGAAFKVIALDGHDLNQPTDLTNVSMPIGAAQRYDIGFVMPASGSVALIDGNDRAEPVGQHPMAIFGADATALTYPANPTPFDFTRYGTPTTDTITLTSHFDVTENMTLSVKPGFFNGAFTLTFPINGMVYPNIPSINVKLGDVVKIHMTNEAGGIAFPHVMHLHGHVFTVLAHNGQPLTDSPVHVDTVLINPGESYDVAFIANNPGLWMLHCHMIEHDAHGMDMMVVYPDIYTPYTVGTSSGNNPF